MFVKGRRKATHVLWFGVGKSYLSDILGCSMSHNIQATWIAWKWRIMAENPKTGSSPKERIAMLSFFSCGFPRDLWQKVGKKNPKNVYAAAVNSPCMPWAQSMWSLAFCECPLVQSRRWSQAAYALLSPVRGGWSLSPHIQLLLPLWAAGVGSPAGHCNTACPCQSSSL